MGSAYATDENHDGYLFCGNVKLYGIPVILIKLTVAFKFYSQFKSNNDSLG